MKPNWGIHLVLEVYLQIHFAVLESPDEPEPYDYTTEDKPIGQKVIHENGAHRNKMLARQNVVILIFYFATRFISKSYI